MYAVTYIFKSGNDPFIISDAYAVQSTGCSCIKSNYDCGCCADVKISAIGLNDNGMCFVYIYPRTCGQINLFRGTDLTFDPCYVVILPKGPFVNCYY